MKIPSPERPQAPAKAVESRPVGKGVVQTASSVSGDFKRPLGAEVAPATDLAAAFVPKAQAPVQIDYVDPALDDLQATELEIKAAIDDLDLERESLLDRLTSVQREINRRVANMPPPYLPKSN